MQNVSTTLDTFEKLLVQHEGDYITGHDFTIADIQLFFEATDLEVLGTDFTKYPNLEKWYKKVGENEVIKGIQEKWTEAVAGLKAKF